MTKIPNEAANELRDALDRAADIVRAIADPLERAEACDHAAAELGAGVTEVKAWRAAAFHEARQTMSVDQIATACGISKPRVYQILDGR